MPSQAKPQLDILTQRIETATSESEALKAFSTFTDHLFINHKLYEPETWQRKTWTGWVKSGRDIVKSKFGKNVDFPTVWFNRAEVFNAKDIGQALKDACKAQNKAMYNHIWGVDEEQPQIIEQATEATEKSAQAQDNIPLSDEVQAAINRSGLSQSEFIDRALAAYAKNWQPSGVDVTQLPTHELIGSKRAGAGVELCDRAINAILNHNETTKDLGSRLQVTGAVLKALTRVNAKTCRNAIEQHQERILESYKRVGISPLEMQFNRGKDAQEIITEF